MTTVSRPDEPREVVDVAVRVVAGDAPAEPDDVADAEIVGEDLLEPGAVEPGVAGLDLAEQAFLGREQGAAAVDVDRAPFHHDAGRRAVRASTRGAHRGSPSQRAILRGRRLSRSWLSYLAQPLNFQSTRPTAAIAVRRGLVVDDERRAGVAEPAPIGRGLEESDRVRGRRPTASSWSATRRFIVPPRTTMWTCSTRLRWRTISV